ncbi:MAG: PorT family protein [Dysgonamonadaceae bacterium]|jgi:hypothetical protein|nr:PorT family protein [Dysgonamonadaceae bacterium]
MKKIALGFILLLGTVSLYSQNTDFKPEFAYGITGGVTLSGVRFVPYVAQEKILQNQAGVALRYISEKNFGFQIELNYSNRGWRELTDEVRKNRYARSISYIELPFMTHIYFDMGKRVRGVFNLGPQIGYAVGEKLVERVLYAEPAGYSNAESLYASGNVPDYYFRDIQRKFDYGIIGGGGIELKTGIGRFVLEGRYYFGLSDVFNNARTDYFQASANQVISIKLTYLTSLF